MNGNTFQNCDCVLWSKETPGDMFVLMTEYKSLQSKLAIAMEALEFYGDDSNSDMGGYNDDYESPHQGYGKREREALKKIKE